MLRNSYISFFIYFYIFHTMTEMHTTKQSKWVFLLQSVSYKASKEGRAKSRSNKVIIYVQTVCTTWTEYYPSNAARWAVNLACKWEAACIFYSEQDMLLRELYTKFHGQTSWLCTACTPRPAGTSTSPAISGVVSIKHSLSKRGYSLIITILWKMSSDKGKDIAGEKRWVFFSCKLQDYYVIISIEWYLVAAICCLLTWPAQPANKEENNTHTGRVTSLSIFNVMTP